MLLRINPQTLLKTDSQTLLEITQKILKIDPQLLLKITQLLLKIDPQKLLQIGPQMLLKISHLAVLNLKTYLLVTFFIG